MNTMRSEMKSTRRDAPVFALVSIDEWIALQASKSAALQAELDEEPLDPREWGGSTLVTGTGPTMLAVGATAPLAEVVLS